MNSDAAEKGATELAPVTSTRKRWAERIASHPWMILALALAALIGLPFTIADPVLPFWTKDTKGLSIYQVDKRLLLTRDPAASTGVAGELQIIFEGREVKSPWASTVTS